MSDIRAIIPSDTSEWLELSEEEKLALSRQAQGRVFEKHILNMGKLIHPTSKTPIDVDRTFVDTMIKNFNDKVCDIVQVPLAGPRNEHTEAPERNTGEVIGLRERDGKVYAVIDARDEDAANKLGKTLLGASAMISTDYTDTRTGKKVGPTLLHTCITNRPYITDLEDYREIVAATADNSGEDAAVFVPNVETSEKSGDEGTIEASQQDENEETVNMTLEEMIAALKVDHNIDVPALQAAAASAGDVASLSNAFQEAVNALEDTGILRLSNGNEVTPDQLVGSIKEVVELTNTQRTRIDKLERSGAEAEVARKVEQGYLLPTQKDAMVTLYLTNPDVYSALLPAEPIIKLSDEQGTEATDADAQERNEQQEAVDRYSKQFGLDK